MLALVRTRRVMHRQHRSRRACRLHLVAFRHPARREQPRTRQELRERACVGHRVTMLMVMSAIVARVASSHDTLFIPLEPREKLSQGHSAGKSVAV
ncbi:hypothetical protein CLOP_g6672 [Closterium sp. NIES-67]|nr:hypothetical protein CLOP_g17266 [Closterium sp. NIES-67]GJP76299.1 hypothetical protein CLOP_g6672 [Closterium sp. NIES-67]